MLCPGRQFPGDYVKGLPRSPLGWQVGSPKESCGEGGLLPLPVASLLVTVDWLSLLVEVR